MKNKIIYLENETLPEDLLYKLVDTDLFQVVGKVVLGEANPKDPREFGLVSLKERKDEWDYFLYALGNTEIENMFNQLFDKFGLDKSCMVDLFAVPLMETDQIFAVNKLLKTGCKLSLQALYRTAGCLNDYTAVSAEGLTFIADSSDVLIPVHMAETKNVWAADDMKRLAGLLKEYYSIDGDSEGTFFDIGANIGTTSIYIKKKIYPNFKICSFEPMDETYKLLSTNMVLNEMKDYDALNVALSSESTEYKMVKAIGNWGGSFITKNDGEGLESVVSSTLDEYVNDAGVDMDKPMVLWIDTEGFEVDVFMGASKVLEHKPAIFFEFNLDKYGDKIDTLVDILNANYSGYILFENDSNEVLNDFSKLKERIPEKQVDIFLVP